MWLGYPWVEYLIEIINIKITFVRNLEGDGFPSKENKFGQSTLLMDATYIVFAKSDL